MAKTFKKSIFLYTMFRQEISYWNLSSIGKISKMRLIIGNSSFQVEI